MITTKDENAGKKAKCPTCGAVLTIAAPPKATMSMAGAPNAGAALEDDVAAMLGQSAAASGPPSPPVPPRFAPVNNGAGGFYSPAANPTANNQHRSPAKSQSTSYDEPGFLDFDSSVLKGLFDLNFRRFITPSIIKSLYATHMLFVLIFLFFLVWTNYVLLAGTAIQVNRSPALTYFLVAMSNVGAILFLFVWTLITRLCLEAVMVLFRGEEHLRELAESAHRRSSATD
jgi:hypothetical protein